MMRLAPFARFYVSLVNEAFITETVVWPIFFLSYECFLCSLLFKDLNFYLFLIIFCILIDKSKRKAMNRNWYNQKANPALNTKAGNK